MAAERRRILFVSGEYPPRIGGVGDHVARLREALDAQGATTFVATESLQRSDPETGAFAMPSGPLGRLLIELPALARRLDADVVHIQFQAGAFRRPGQVLLLPLALGAARVRAKLAVTFHDLAQPYLLPKLGRLRGRAMGFLRQRADVCIYVDAHDRALECGRVPGQWRKCRVIPAGPTIVPPDDLASRAELRARLGFAPGEFLVGYFGFRQQGKGLDTLAAALLDPRFQARRPRLVLIGAGIPAVGERRADRAAPETALSGLDVVRSGTLTPREVSEWIRCCDVMALPFRQGLSTRRGSFMVAVAHGIPVVTTEPTRPELLDIRPTEVAYVPPGDVRAFATVLDGLATDPARLNALTEGSRAVAQRYSWRRIARQTLDAYGG